ncbi:ferredoxin--NADP reductase [Humidisolicoccus flavus]|uniref:ferredoxin--NADP reductase n=1 Tax=Humidisolicoccus flavus TaxID=3111414 RepID=UPI0032520615
MSTESPATPPPASAPKQHSSQPLAAALARIDGVPMHVLVAMCLGITAIAAIVFSFVGVFTYNGFGMLLALVVALAASLLTNWLFAKLARTAPHQVSAVITGYLIFFLCWPGGDALSLLTITAVAFLASGSKYLIVWRKGIIVNAAALGAVVVGFFGAVPGSGIATELWWVASLPLTPFIVVSALLIWYRTRTFSTGVLFVAVAGLGLTAILLAFGLPVDDALRTAFITSPALFLGAFMLTEPLTLPPRKPQRLLVAVVVAVLLILPTLISLLGAHPAIGFVTLSPALALIIGNLVAFFVGKNRSIQLTLVERRTVSPHIVELEFTAKPAVEHRAGQYLELTIPHLGADQKGTRRVFSIASAPGDETVTIGVRIGDKPSSFKQELIALEPGDTIRATRHGGDFTPKSHSESRLYLAAGIGITPFLSHLAEARKQGGALDSTLVLLLRAGEPVPFATQLAASGVTGIVIAPTAPEVLPAGWTYAGSERLDADRLRALVPDVRERVVYVSGAPRTVSTLAAASRKAGARRVKTDAFAGY